jgi:hypothetical protein
MVADPPCPGTNDCLPCESDLTLAFDPGIRFVLAFLSLRTICPPKLVLR